MPEPEVLVPGLSKAESIALEALFVQDLPGENAAAIGRKVGKALVAKGYAEPAHFTIGTGPLAVKVGTFTITIAGHMAYCEACPEPDESQL